VLFCAVVGTNEPNALAPKLKLLSAAKLCVTLKLATPDTVVVEPAVVLPINIVLTEEGFPMFTCDGKIPTCYL